MFRSIKPLHEQVILIAGAMSPLGHEAVHQAVERGAKLFLVDRNKEELLARKVELERNGYDVSYSVANFEDVSSLEQAIHHCLLNFGRIDTLLFLLHRLDSDFVRAVILPSMSESGGGTIINVVDEALYRSLKRTFLQPKNIWDQNFSVRYCLINIRRFKSISRLVHYLLRESSKRRTFTDGLGVRVEELAHSILRTIRTFGT